MAPAPDAGAAGMSDPAAASTSAPAADGEAAVKRQRTDDPSSADGGVAAPETGQPAPVAPVAQPDAAAAAGPTPDDDSAANLEASLQSCTAHRDRILQMLVEEPNNQNLIELRDQLTNAINQLQGTKNMVQRARGGARPAGAMVGGAAERPAKGHSSRKNKPQRCSVCGGIGHKSRTCSMAVTPNAQQMCPPVQWAAQPAGCMAAQPQTDASGQVQYVQVNGGYMMAAPGAQPGVPPGATAAAVPMMQVPTSMATSMATVQPTMAPAGMVPQMVPQQLMPQQATMQPAAQAQPMAVTAQPQAQVMTMAVAPTAIQPATVIPVAAETQAVAAAEPAVMAAVEAATAAAVAVSQAPPAIEPSVVPVPMEAAVATEMPAPVPVPVESVAEAVAES